MSDIATIWDGTRGDYQQVGAGISSGSDLATAILISLFTDRRAGADDVVPDGSGDPRGWWGDPTMGSRVWLLERAKRTQATIQAAKGYIEEALQWLIDDDVVAGFQIDVEWPPGAALHARVVALRNDGTRDAMKFTWVWN